MIIIIKKGYILYDPKKTRTDEEKIQFKKKYNCDVCHVNNSRQVSLKEHFAGKNNTL